MFSLSATSRPPFIPLIFKLDAFPVKNDVGAQWNAGPGALLGDTEQEGHGGAGSMGGRLPTLTPTNYLPSGSMPPSPLYAPNVPGRLNVNGAGGGMQGHYGM